MRIRKYLEITTDGETTISNKGNPFDYRNSLISYSIKINDERPTFYYRDNLGFTDGLRRLEQEAVLLVGFNLKFDLHHYSNVGLALHPTCRVWDCQLADFILSGQTNRYPSLNSVAEYYGLPLKKDKVKEYWDKGISTEYIPVDILEEYNNYDVDLTYMVYEKQLSDPRMTPTMYKTILLCGLDLLVLQEMEYAGIPYNIEKSHQSAEALQRELNEIEQSLNAINTTAPINWDSGDQLSCFLYGGTLSVEQYNSTECVYKSGIKKGQPYLRRSKLPDLLLEFPGYFTPLPRSAVAKSKYETNPKLIRYSTAEPVLKQLSKRSKVQKDIISLLLRRSTITKLISTYLEALPNLIETMGWADGKLHGQYNQVVAATGRLSSSNPNQQNMADEAYLCMESRYE